MRRKYQLILPCLVLVILGLNSCVELSKTSTIPEAVVVSTATQAIPPKQTAQESQPTATTQAVQTGQSTEQHALEENEYCAGSNTHPIGESISITYDVTYEEVMRLYCSGFSFDNILLAFATSDQTDYEYSPRELLQLKLTSTWEEVWEEIGILENN